MSSEQEEVVADFEQVRRHLLDKGGHLRQNKENQQDIEEEEREGTLSSYEAICSARIVLALCLFQGTCCKSTYSSQGQH